MERYPTKSVMIGRKPRAKPEHDFKTASFKLFRKEMNPLASVAFPDQEIDIENIERIEFAPLCPSYYLEGNDLVATNLTAIEIEQKENVLYVKFVK